MMYKKLPHLMFLAAAVAVLGGCEYLRARTPKDFLTNPFAPSEEDYALQGQEMTPTDIRPPASIVVCRSHQCAPAKLSMSKQYIYNSLLHLFENNNYQKILICQADPYTHTCLENYITLPIIAGITPTNAYIDHVKVTDVIIGKRANKINLILNYNLTFGGQTPDCTPSRSIVFARSVNHVIMEDSGYTCKMTAIGQTTVKTVFAIDYIDLDYGYIGGYYSVGLSGPAHGGGNGYMLLRLPKNAYPLAPELKAPEQPASGKRKKSGSATSSFGSNEAPRANQGSGIISEGVQIFPLESKKAEPLPEASAPADSATTTTATEAPAAQ